MPKGQWGRRIGDSPYAEDVQENYLRRRRVEQQLTTHELGALVGLVGTDISKLENGTDSPLTTQNQIRCPVQRILDYFHAEFEDIFHRDACHIEQPPELLEVQMVGISSISYTRTKLSYDVRKALKALKHKERQALVWRFCCGLSGTQLATRWNTSDPYVNQVTNTAKTKLATLLAA